MAETINMEITALRPEVTAELSKLRYLVFQGAESWASSENVLALTNRTSNAQNAAATAAGMRCVYQPDGTFSVTGTNTGSANAIFNVTEGTLSSGKARKPEPGIYRLEIGADSAADFTAIWGVLYLNTTLNYVVTDAAGRSAEIYLDGDTMVSAGIVVSPGATAEGLKLTLALRRIGVPETGALLVDQLNQTRAMQRKLLGLLDMAAQVSQVQDCFPGLEALMTRGVLAVPTVAELTPNNDMNELFNLASYSLIVARYDANTAHTPRANNISTGFSAGVVLHYNAGSNYGVELVLVSGGGQLAKRRRSGGTFSDWEEIT